MMFLILWIAIATRAALIIDSDSVAVMLSGLALFWYLGEPRWKTGSHSKTPYILAILGLAADSFLLMTSGCVLTLTKCADVKNKSSYLLVFFSCPWLMVDFHLLGWWFRLSAAWVTGFLLKPLGLVTSQKGTQVFLQDFVLIVEPTCSGLNLLQALLLVGLALLLKSEQTTPLRGWHVLALLAVAWVANTARILMLAVAGSFVGPDRLAGDAHLWLGWILFLFFFAIWQERACS